MYVKETQDSIECKRNRIAGRFVPMLAKSESQKNGSLGE